MFNPPFTAAVPSGTTFNIVGTPSNASGVVAANAVAAAAYCKHVRWTRGACSGCRSRRTSGSARPEGLNPTDGFYVGQALTFTNGPNAGLSRVITAYTGTAAPVFTFEDPFPAAPAAGNLFVIQPAIPAPIGSVVAAAPPSTTTVINTPPVAVSGLSAVAGRLCWPIVAVYDRSARRPGTVDHCLQRRRHVYGCKSVLCSSRRSSDICNPTGQRGSSHTQLCVAAAR